MSYTLITNIRHNSLKAFKSNSKTIEVETRIKSQSQIKTLK